MDAFCPRNFQKLKSRWNVRNIRRCINYRRSGWDKGARIRLFRVFAKGESFVRGVLRVLAFYFCVGRIGTRAFEVVSLSLRRRCLPPFTLPGSKARETESYREWRVRWEISKFPFNGIIKRSGRDRVTADELVEIPRGRRVPNAYTHPPVTANFSPVIISVDVPPLFDRLHRITCPMVNKLESFGKLSPEFSRNCSRDFWPQFERSRSRKINLLIFLEFFFYKRVRIPQFLFETINSITELRRLIERLENNIWKLSRLNKFVEFIKYFNILYTFHNLHILHLKFFRHFKFSNNLLDNNNLQRYHEQIVEQ